MKKLEFVKDMPIATQKLELEKITMTIDFNCRFTQNPLLFIIVSMRHGFAVLEHHFNL